MEQYDRRALAVGFVMDDSLLCGEGAHGSLLGGAWLGLFIVHLFKDAVEQLEEHGLNRLLLFGDTG